MFSIVIPTINNDRTIKNDKLSLLVTFATALLVGSFGLGGYYVRWKTGRQHPRQASMFGQLSPNDLRSSALRSPHRRGACVNNLPRRRKVYPGSSLHLLSASRFSFALICEERTSYLSIFHSEKPTRAEFFAPSWRGARRQFASISFLSPGNKNTKLYREVPSFKTNKYALRFPCIDFISNFIRRL